MSVTSNSIVWDVQFTRTANDWEMEEFTAFYSTFYDKVVRRDSEDKLIWKGSTGEVFSVKSFYGLIFGEQSESFPWCGVWKTKVP